MPAPELVSVIDVKIGGQVVDDDKVHEIRVEDNLVLPDVCTVKITGWEAVDSPSYAVGKAMEVKLGAATGQPKPVFFGEVVSAQPEFGKGGAVSLTVRGYDRGHRLNRAKKTKTYQQQTYSDIAHKLASDNGLTAGTIDSAPGGRRDFVQQSNETDWEFLWRLARRIGFEVVVSDRRLNFRRSGSANRGTVQLKYGETLLEFRPRITAVQQVKDVVVKGWDPKSKQEIEAKAPVRATATQIGLSHADIVNAFSSGQSQLVLSDTPVESQDEAAAVAAGVAAKVADAHLEAEGTSVGNPDLGAGTTVDIKDVGQSFSGKYLVTRTVHQYGKGGYVTHFHVGGQAPRSLIDLLTPAKGNGRSGGGGFGAGGVVVGVVTNNDDPDGLGRVRVKYPALSGSEEGWWARIASQSAGKDRGLLMMPVVSEEVLVAFEHGDPRRPYVVGSLWNGTEKPGDLVQKDGSFVLASDKFVNVTAKESISIKSDKDWTLETKQKITDTSQQDYSIESKTAAVKVKAGTSVTIEGTQSIELKCGAASVSIQAAGQMLEIKCGAAKVTMSSAGAVSISGTAISLG